MDLFGDPVRLPSGRRGRPAHRYSQKNANKIMMLLALGWSVERVAAGCHISVPTLKKYYFSVLKTRAIQRDRLVAWQFERLMELAAAGNVSALKELQQMIERNDRMAASASLRDEADAPQPEKLGKKEQARRAAMEATEHGEWGSLLSGGYDA
ncbi:hypothetical protein C6Y53_02090 [Pukyongiella litopenaei]|uniref:Resolvase HTH domain-containing protein n=1 Tax=Pukyongiella litopenaei TaxID=2605946 RepID=A0A2S0MUX3_9RHOB|nr:hypothetical protein C6Y53_02090 [Pukyongiella litopenaei]